MARLFALTVAVAMAGCTSAKPPGPKVVGTLTIAVIADHGEPVGALSDRLESRWPAVGVVVERTTRYSDHLPPRERIDIDGPSQAVLRSEIGAAMGEAPPLRMPDGWAVAYGTPDEAPDEAPWRAYLLRAKDRLDLDQDTHARIEEIPGEPAGIMVTLSKADGARFGAMTREHDGDRLAIVRGDQVISAPQVQGEVPGQQVLLSLGGQPSTSRQRATALLAELVGSADE